MMLHRIGAILIVGCLLISLAACRSETAASPGEVTEPTALTTVANTTSEADTSTTGFTDPTTTTSAPTNTATSTTTMATRPTKAATTTRITTTTVATTTGTTLPREVRVTITEGKSMVEIFRELEANHVASFDALMETAETYDYSYYPLVAAIPARSDRCYRLEGYLFPDTYMFYIDSKPQDVIGKFLRNAETKLAGYEDKARAMGYTLDEILTIASIIQEEGAKASEMPNVSAVIHNRLRSGMRLQMDATINYVERWVKPYISGDKDRYNAAYNTYKCGALPAGPIGNPGMRAIEAALAPAAVDYLYFCTESGKDSPRYFYATTYAEHEENLKQAGLIAE